MTSSEHSFMLSKTSKPANHYLVQTFITKEKTLFSDLFLTIFLYFTITIVLLVWLAPLTRRISQLTHAADDFGRGKLDSRVSVFKWSYTKKLDNSFNQMAEKIEQLIDENKLLSSNISHDLRTPLSCLRFGVDAALSAKNAESSARYLKRVDEELENMEHMLTAFLEFACLSRKSQNIVRMQVNINQVVISSLSSLVTIAEAENMILKQNLESRACFVSIDRHWIERCFSNLISNAIAYGETTVYVSTRMEKGHFVLSVDDDGKGISEKEKKMIFTPFTRLEANRNRNTKHFGLGLAIVNTVAQWHSAATKVERSHLGGARFTFTIPLSNSGKG